MAGNPVHGQTSTNAGSSPTGCATRSFIAAAARHQRGVGRRRRLARVGGDRPDPEPGRDRAQPRLARATRATARMGGYDDLDLDLCESLYNAGPSAVTRAVLRVLPPRAVNARRVVRLRRRRRPPVSRSTPPRAASPTAYDGALFFSDYSRKCIWVMLYAYGDGALPTRRQVERLRRCRGRSGRSPVRPPRRPRTTSTSAAARSAASVRHQRNPAPIARATATPSRGPRAADRGVRRRAPPATPAGGAAHLRVGPRRRRPVRRFDVGRPEAHLLDAGSRARRACAVRDAADLTDLRLLPIVAGTPPVPSITVAGRWLACRRIDRVQRQRRPGAAT